MPGTPRTVDALADDLRRLGVTAGATVMVHASLRRIGPVQSGGDGVVAALDRAVGADGTLLMTLGASDDHDWVNERPEPERAALLAGAEPFDPLVTPAQPDVGTLAELFRRTPGTLVSDHPEGRFGARGRLARRLVENPPWDDYYGPGSPLERFVDAGGHVLRLGADPDTVTVLHYAEYLCEVPGKRRVRRHRRVQGPDGPVIRVVECLDDEHGIAEHRNADGNADHTEDYFVTILRSYLATGRARTGRVGDATCELLDAADLVTHGARWMTEHLGPR